MTRDEETIRQWAEEYDVDPVRTTETQSTEEHAHPYQFRTDTGRTETMETLTWDEFFREIDSNDLVIVFHGDESDRPMEVLDRDEAVAHASVAASEFEERLLEGETITSEVTDTTVIERTIVEHATIESEVVDTELIDSRVVDVELRSREISGYSVTDRHLLDELDRSRFEDVNQLTAGFREDLLQPIGVEVTVEENWDVTRELLERATIESRIIDVDATETDEIESESYESSIEIEGVQKALLESDVIELEADTDEVIETGTIESEFHEDNVVRTQLNQLRVLEDVVTERKALRGQLTESEVLEADTKTSVTSDAAFVEGDSFDEGMTTGSVTGPGAEMGQETQMDYEAEPGHEADAGQQADMSQGTDHGEGVRMTVTEEDEGKPVVTADGEELGMIEEVRGTTAYVNPEPGLVDRLKSKLGWGDADEGDYTIDETNIARITDDEVELSVPR